jgi:hypothetical protein
MKQEPNKLDWSDISAYQTLSEPFIREFQDRLNWRSITLHQTLSESFIREFQDRLDWYEISAYQTLSEPFMREFQNRLNWPYISRRQTLSEPFMREFQNRLNWYEISRGQTLSEPFIREFQDRLNWRSITLHQTLSEPFIREFQDRLDWSDISAYQTLSEPFMREFKDKLNIKVYNEVHKEPSKEKKIATMREYAKTFNLKFDGTFLYAYRNHNKRGGGQIKLNSNYKKGNYYRDWHCDMRREVENSFGFGLWPKGNTPVKVSVKDFGVVVDRKDGKCRVWGFTVLE